MEQDTDEEETEDLKLDSKKEYHWRLVFEYISGEVDYDNE